MEPLPDSPPATHPERPMMTRRLVDFVIGIGQAFDPLPRRISPSFIREDKLAFAVDAYAVASDCKSSEAAIQTVMSRFMNTDSRKAAKNVDGKTRRTAENV